MWCSAAPATTSRCRISTGPKAASPGTWQTAATSGSRGRGKHQRPAALERVLLRQGTQVKRRDTVDHSGRGVGAAPPGRLEQKVDRGVPDALVADHPHPGRFPPAQQTIRGLFAEPRRNFHRPPPQHRVQHSELIWPDTRIDELFSLVGNFREMGEPWARTSTTSKNLTSCWKNGSASVPKNCA